jgi:hypothetical protein
MLVCHWCGIQSDYQYVLFEMSDLLKNPWRLTQANIQSMNRGRTVQYDPAKIRSWGDPARNIAKPDLKQMELSLLHISSLKSRKSGDPISVILAMEIPTKNRLQQVQALIPATPPLQGLRWNDP